VLARAALPFAGKPRYHLGNAAFSGLGRAAPAERLLSSLRQGMRPMIDPKPTHRRSLWPVLVPLILVVALAIVWTGLWFDAAAAAEETLDGWRAREAKSGRVYSCATQTIGGYPFPFEVRGVQPALGLAGREPPLAAHAAG